VRIYIDSSSKTDPLVVPSLSIHNAGKKAMTITRETGVVNVNPSSTEELRDGDTVDIIGGVSLRRVVLTYHHLVY
jgi:hypothetical protein